MVGPMPPAPGRNAWRDSATRRALVLYSLRAVGWFVLALAFVTAARSLLDDDGGAKQGVPYFLSFLVITPGLLALLLGSFTGLRAFQMTWAALRREWLVVDAAYEDLPMSGPNGQSVLLVSREGEVWALALAAMSWRQNSFRRAPTLLLAAKRGRGGLVATLDRRSVAWAGRPAFTGHVLRRRGRQAEHQT